MKCNILEFEMLHTENLTGISILRNSGTVKKITYGSVKKITNLSSIAYSMNALEELYFTEWKQGNATMIAARLLKSQSIHYIIQNAMSLADGATARTLTLNATAKTNWQNSEYYEQDLAVLTDKGITIA